MRKRYSLLSRIGLGLGLALLGGCDLGIDPDSLVRELRILGMKVATGDPAAAGGPLAELQAEVGFGAGGLDVAFTTNSVTLSALVADPTGPGRRTLTPRPLQHDFYLCIGIKSLYSPGSIDPTCRRWGPTDPDPKTNGSLVYLNSAGTMAASSPSLTVPTEVLKGILLSFLQTALSGGANQSGTGGSADMAGGATLPMRPQVILLPVILRSSVVGGDPADSRNSEVGYNYLRVVIAIPALGIRLPPPNRSPVLNPAQVGPQSAGAMQPLLPCPASGGPCQPYSMPRTAQALLTGQLADGSIETYTPIDDSGRTGVAETLRFSWFATDGEFSELRTGTMKPQTRWQSGEKYPAAATVNKTELWLVVQDERGGTDWAEYNLQLQ